MSSSSAIEWTEATWNPTTGCSRVSAGCDHCYAVWMTHRLEGAAKGAVGLGQLRHKARHYVGLTVLNGKGDRHFNGVVRCVDEELTRPLRWKKPARIFVNSMSDLFHPEVPFEFIDKVFAVMALTPQHTYQVLTKRPERMAEYFRESTSPHDDRAADRIAGASFELGEDHLFDRKIFNWSYDEDGKIDPASIDLASWPLPNVWLGTSVENQEWANKRIPHLLKCPAVVRFLSCEPLLGPIHLRGGIYEMPGGGTQGTSLDQIHWVIVGGESRKGARPFDFTWARSIRDQCSAASVPFFFKQAGRVAFDSAAPDREFATYQTWVNKAKSWIGGLDAICLDARGRRCEIGEHFMRADKEGAFPVRAFVPLPMSDTKGGDMSEWPEDLRVREFPKERA